MTLAAPKTATEKRIECGVVCSTQNIKRNLPFYIMLASSNGKKYEFLKSGSCKDGETTKVHISLETSSRENVRRDGKSQKSNKGLTRHPNQDFETSVFDRRRKIL